MKTAQVRMAPLEAITLIFNAPWFAKCCDAAGVPVTRRQASKYRNGYGAAWNARKK